MAFPNEQLLRLQWPSSTSTPVALQPIPRDVESGALISNVIAHLRGRGAQYYAIIPYVIRINDEPDWAPPCRNIEAGYNDVSTCMRQAYADQSYALYCAIEKALTCTDMMNMIKHDVFDGPSAYSALLQRAILREIDKLEKVTVSVLYALSGDRIFLL